MEGKLCFLSKASIAWIFSQIASVDSFEKGERVLPSVFLLLQSALDLESSQWRWFYIETLPKAQRTRGLSSSYQSNFLRSYHNFTNLDQISSSESRLKNQFLNQTSASPINLKFKISTKHSFRIATKIQLHNLYKTLAAKCWTNSSSQINKLLPTWSSTSTSATVTTLTSFELASSHARVTSIKFTKHEWVSQWVS